MFERFTERARQVVVLAQDEARALGHDYIGTEHILLGLLREEQGLAARVLESLGVTVEDVQAQVARIVGRGDEVTAGQIPFTPRAKKVLELALKEAVSLGHNYIGTEHLLLGIVRENEGVAMRILLDFDADAEKIRGVVIRMLSGPGRRSEGASDSGSPVPPELGEELARVRKEKESALEARDFERAARLRDQELKLVGLTNQLEAQELALSSAGWTGYGPALPLRRRLLPRKPPRADGGGLTWTSGAVLAGAAALGIGVAAGLVLGWLIWG